MVVVGAGSMASLATATVSRLGAAEIVVVNRSVGSADRLAEEYAARAVAVGDLESVLGTADLVDLLHRRHRASWSPAPWSRPRSATAATC